jgi:lipid A ethanolaminephosphotransferase
VGCFCLSKDKAFICKTEDMKIWPFLVAYRHPQFLHKLRCNSLEFIWIFTLCNTLLFQLPLLTYARSNLAWGSLNTTLTLITLIVIQAGLMLTVLLFASMASLRLLKALCAFFLLGNVLALHFISSYNVILDRAMMGNVFNTDVRETLELISIKLALYLIAAVLMPSIVIFRLQIEPDNWTRKIATLIAVVVLSTGWIYVNSSTWLWIDKHAKHLGSLMLPWSYVVNTARHYDQVATKNRHQTLLPSAHFLSNTLSKNKKVVVLVMGMLATPTHIQNCTRWLHCQTRVRVPLTPPNLWLVCFRTKVALFHLGQVMSRYQITYRDTA